MEQLLEFEWLFGSEAEAVMEQMASEGMHRILESDNALSAEEQVLSDKSSHGSLAPAGPRRRRTVSGSLGNAP